MLRLVTFRVVVSIVSISFAATLVPAAARSQAGPARIDGRTVDAQSGLLLDGATVSIVGRESAATSDRAGTFALSGLAPGSYTLRVVRDGYQPQLSEPLTLRAGDDAHVTVSLQAVAAARDLKIVGRTATKPGEALQKSSTISRTLNAEALAGAGIFRAGDALRALPGAVNGINGDTGAFGDDINLSVRGIGTLETSVTLDGHPIAIGVPGGYNLQLSPIVPFRNMTLTYGSGSNLAGESAIGGTIDLQTLEPTPERRATIAQGYGTFGKRASTLQATGTAGRLGYALAYGVAGQDGPIAHARTYQPGAAYDASASDPAVRGLAVYDDDSSALSHSGLVSLHYALGTSSRLTFTSVAGTYYSNKTGNGDGDYLEYAPALAFGKQLLANYSPSKYPTLAACPAGSFVATNANGHVNGTGPNGQPDGGSACETPAQYASFVTGFQGAGPAFQSFVFDDEHIGFASGGERWSFHIDGYTNRYNNWVDRSAQLPYKTLPGDVGRIKIYNVVTSGWSAHEDLTGGVHEVSLGYSYANVAYNLASVALTGATVGAPIVRETNIILRDAYHPGSSPLTAFADLRLNGATATNSTALDPRLSLVYSASARDVVRLSAGATTTQPAGNQLGQPFAAAPPGGAGGGATITCAGLNSIGNVPSAALLPERGVDKEAAYGHRFGDDSQVQIALYNVDVFNKLYSTKVPLSQTGTAFIDPAYLVQVTAAVAAKCGVPGASALLGLTGTFNVGQLRAQGFTLSGRKRIDRATALDYDWTLDSTVLLSAPAALLQSNLTLVPGSQLPHLPLHTLAAGIDRRFGTTDARFGFHAVSANNTKNLPPYAYSDLLVTTPLGRGSLSAAVSNLFNQYADIRGLQYEGVPLALNANATAASYAPYTGAAATEQFGLPDRTVYIGYTLHLR